MAVARRGCLRVLACLELQPARDEQAQQHGHQRDQHQPADELGERELPPDQHPHEQAELDHEIGGGELERERAGSRCAGGEQRSGDRDGGVGAGRGGGAEPGRRRDTAEPAVAERALDPLARNPRLDDPGEGEAQHQRPPHVPGHQERVGESFPDGVESARHGLSRWFGSWAAVAGESHGLSLATLVGAPPRESEDRDRWGWVYASQAACWSPQLPIPADLPSAERIGRTELDG